MTEIKPGMVVYMKTTEDPMFVLSVTPMATYHTLAGTLSGVEAKVRRPFITEKGSVQYSVETYLIDELETKEDASTRKIAELEELKARVQSNDKAQKSPGGLGLSN